MTPNKMKLYHSASAPNSRRVRIFEALADALSLIFEHIDVEWSGLAAPCD